MVKTSMKSPKMVNNMAVDSDDEVDSNIFEEVGSVLKQNKEGIYLNDNSVISRSLYYHSAPSNPSLVLLTKGTIIRYDRKLLLDLCNKFELKHGIVPHWNCEVKGPGALRATCKRAGLPRKSKGNGERNKISMKIGCLEKMTTVPLNYLEEEQIIDILKKTFFDDDNAYRNDIRFCKINTISMEHHNHTIESALDFEAVVNTTQDLLSNDKMKYELCRLIEYCGREKGFGLKAWFSMQELFPKYKISYNAIRNSIYILNINEKDAYDLILYLKELKDQGAVEYLSYGLTKSNVLEYVTWSFNGSYATISRQGDIIFWDSTHNMTKYCYKLATFTAVDSENRSRAVMFNLGLSEDSTQCHRILTEWYQAFGCSLLPVIFTDGDEAMHSALLRLPYRVTHILCIFHLFDTNVKAFIGPSLKSSNGSDACVSFREALNMCREAGSEKNFNELWEQLFVKWFPDADKFKKERRYLHDHVWVKRKQWCTAFFPEAFTLGHSTTQRPESFNALLKCFKNSSSLSQLVSKIKNLVIRQSSMERKTLGEPALRLQPLSNCKDIISSDLVDILIDSCFSRFCTWELSKSIFSSTSLHVVNVSHEQWECGANGFKVTADVFKLYTGENEKLKTTVSVEFNLDSSNLHSDIPFLVKAQCKCLYMKRMKIPCKHIISLGIYFDTMEVNGESHSENSSSKIRIVSDLISSLTKDHDIPSFLQLFLLQCIGKRWIVEVADVQPSNNQMENTWRQINSPIVGFNQTKESRSIKERDTLNLSPDHTYYEMVGNAKSLVEKVISFKNEGLKTQFNNFFLNCITKLNSYDSINSFDNEDFHLMLDKEVKGKTIGPNFNNSNDETLNDIDIDNQINIKNPSKIMDNRKNMANFSNHKTRNERIRRVEKSRKLPIQGRDICKREIPGRPLLLGYACTFCDSLKVQNNIQNVKQHILSRHSENKLPSVQEMINAALILSGAIVGDNGLKSISTGLGYKHVDAAMDVTHAVRETIKKTFKISKKWKNRCSLNVGKRINEQRISNDQIVEVFWRPDLKWYKGKIKCTASASSSNHKTVDIIYEDGDVETAMSGDGMRFVSGSDDKTVIVWDKDNGEWMSTVLRSHEGTVTSVTMSGNGTRIVSGSDDNTLRVWDYDNGEWIQSAVLTVHQRVSFLRIPENKELIEAIVGLVEMDIVWWSFSTGSWEECGEVEEVISRVPGLVDEKIAQPTPAYRKALKVLRMDLNSNPLVWRANGFAMYGRRDAPYIGFVRIVVSEAHVYLFVFNSALLRFAI